MPPLTMRRVTSFNTFKTVVVLYRLSHVRGSISWRPRQAAKLVASSAGGGPHPPALGKGEARPNQSKHG